MNILLKFIYLHIFKCVSFYLKENNFHEFIVKHGGHTNAVTDNEHTTFFFHIQEKYLLPALDRFTQFFIKPLMKKDAIIREREAIESGI